jgi:hypothetical protein
VIEADASIVDGAIRRVTTFDADFLTGLQSERFAKQHMRAAELDRVASVPTHVADIWLQQGFDIYRESARAIVARLRRDGLEAFLTSPKSL